MASRGVLCAFCGAGVDPVGLDPLALVVISRFSGAPEDQGEQQFYAHAACLRGRLHPDVLVHADVLDPAWDGY